MVPPPLCLVVVVVTPICYRYRLHQSLRHLRSTAIPLCRCHSAETTTVSAPLCLAVVVMTWICYKSRLHWSPLHLPSTAIPPCHRFSYWNHHGATITPLYRGGWVTYLSRVEASSTCVTVTPARIHKTWPLWASEEETQRWGREQRETKRKMKRCRGERDVWGRKWLWKFWKMKRFIRNEKKILCNELVNIG